MSIQTTDQEVSILALSTLSNILVMVDSLLLADNVNVETLGTSVIPLLDILKQTLRKPQRFYAAAALANASSHPRLASLINQNGGGLIDFQQFLN